MLRILYYFIFLNLKQTKRKRIYEFEIYHKTYTCEERSLFFSPFLKQGIYMEACSPGQRMGGGQGRIKLGAVGHKKY